MTDLLLAIDQGTTGTTCMVLDERRTVLGTANVPFPQYFPAPGRVEHDAAEIWDSVCTALAGALDRAAAPLGTDASTVGRRVAAVGITNQRETVGLFEKDTGRPLHRLIVWQDRRTAPACAALKEQGAEPDITAATGLLLDPYFSGTKIAYLLDHVEGARARAERGELFAATVDAFLVHRLSGGTSLATDPSNASRTLLFHLTRGDWDDDLCARLQVPRSVLPPVLPSNARFAVTRGVPGLPDGIPVCGVLGDQQAALFGQGCLAPATAKCTYGTGAFIMRNTGDRPIHSSSRLLSTVAWRIDDATTYALEGSAFMAGAVVGWLRDNLGIVERAADIEDLARSVNDSGGVVFVPAHTGLGAPHWCPSARAVVTGISRGTTKAHLARAALEGIALQIADLMDAMAEDAGSPLAVLRVDGGAAANDLLLQIQADVLGTVLERPAVIESTALGAATMAGVGAGMFSDPAALPPPGGAATRFAPAAASGQMAALRRAYARAVRLAIDAAAPA